MIAIDEDGNGGARCAGQCYCCSATNNKTDDDGDPIADVRDIIFTNKNGVDRRLPLCIECRSELHDELTPDDAGEAESNRVKELDW